MASTSRCAAARPWGSAAAAARKTTLLREMNLLMRPSAGKVEVLGVDILSVGEDALTPLRRRIGVMFQHGALFSALTVKQNVAVPLNEHTDLPVRLKSSRWPCSRSPSRVWPRARHPCTRASCPAGCRNARPWRGPWRWTRQSYSSTSPPRASTRVSAEAFDALIVQLKCSLNLTVVLVTHNLDTLWRVTDRVAFLATKRVVACAPIAELPRHPHPEIQAYFTGPRGRAAAQAAGSTRT